MKIKRFVADTMAEAVMKVKADFGTEAIIVHTRRFKEQGSLPFLNTEKIEVMAALNPEKKELNSTNIERELQQLKSLIYELNDQLGNKGQDKNKLPSTLDKYTKSLQQAGVSEELIKGLLHQIDYFKNENNYNDLMWLSLFKEALIAGLPSVSKLTVPAKGSKIVALIGPSGAGKTTVLSKLAIRFAFKQKHDLAIISWDYRGKGAAAQLEHFCQNFGLDFAFVENSFALRGAMEQFTAKQLVLIDTPGVNPFKKDSSQKFFQTLKNCSINEILLVLSLNLKDEDLIRYRNRYRSIPFNGYVFTKLDETKSWGSLINLTLGEAEYISYLSGGNNLEGDLELMQIDNFLDCIGENIKADDKIVLG